MNVELLVHSEVNVNKLGFSGLSPKILYYKCVKWFKTFYEKIKALIESKDSQIYFCNKFIICQLNMYLKYYYTEIKFFISTFCYKNGLLPFNWGARWLSGRVSDSGARGPGFETYRRRVVSLSKTLYSPKVLVNYPGSDGSVPT